MSSLPPELWHEILRHIPVRLKYPKLLAVNSVVFHILMNTMWKNVTIMTIVRHEAMRTAQRLQDPAVAVRVHSMNLDISLCRQPIGDILAALSSCTIHLVNMTEFSCSLFTRDGLKPVYGRLRPLFKHIWVSLGSKLRSLTLTAEITQYEDFALDGSTLSGLELDSLHLILYCPASDNLQQTPLTTTILPCLSSISSQLKSLGLTFWWPIVDTSDFLAQIPPFPRLRSLSLLLPSNVTSPSIRHFLENCVVGLRTLNLDLDPFPLNEAVMSEISDCLQHSRVQTLIVRPQSSPTDSLRRADALRKVVHAVRETVISVIARTIRLSTTEEFLPLLTALATCHSLSHLEIHFNTLNTLILGKLAQSLPRLDSLVILHRTEYRSPQYESLFNSLTAEEYYSTWKLRSLSVYRITRTTPDKRLASAIRLLLPSVQALFPGSA